MKKIIKARSYDNLEFQPVKGWNLCEDENCKNKKVFDLLDEENQVAISIKIGKKNVTFSVHSNSSEHGFGDCVFEKKIRYGKAKI